MKFLAGAGAQIDTTSANRRLAFGIFAAFAEFESELIAERTLEGVAAARGRMGGWPRKTNRATLTMAMPAMSDRDAVAADVAKRLGITTTTLHVYVYVNGDGTPKAQGQALLDAGPPRRLQSQAA